MDEKTPIDSIVSVA